MGEMFHILSTILPWCLRWLADSVLGTWQALFDGSARPPWAGKSNARTGSHKKTGSASRSFSAKRHARSDTGCSDPIISQDIAESLDLPATQKKDLVKTLKQDRDGADAAMEKYPSYFQERMNELLQ